MNLLILCRTIMLANNVKLMSKEIVPTFSADDLAKIKKFCKAHSKVRETHVGFILNLAAILMLDRRVLMVSKKYLACGVFEKCCPDPFHLRCTR